MHEATPIALGARPGDNAPPFTLQMVTPPPPEMRSVSPYVAPMTPLGRAFADVMVALVPKLPVTVYGCCIGNVRRESFVVVSEPVQPQKWSPAFGVGVSCTARPSGTKSPERLIAVSAATV